MRRSLSILIVLFFLPSFLLNAQEFGVVRYLGHYVSPSASSSYVSGCWGWTDTVNHREYAIIGCANGTSIVEITDVSNIIERGFVEGPNSSWRELQTWSHYAYAVSEGGGGTQIIDLSYLPDSVHLVQNFIYTSGSPSTVRSHTLHIRDGYMYLNGCASYKSGGIVIFDLADPENPSYLGEYETRYVHDCFVRHDTIYAATINNGGVDIIDATNKANPVMINRFTYSGAGTHNTATTSDGQFLLTTDEVGGTAKTLKFWDLRNPPTVTKVAEYVGAPSAIVHNVFVKDNLAIMSYYTAGLRVVDISDPTHPNELGGYDSYPANDAGQFTGAWSTYPFFPSGKIIIGDMATGLYVVDFAPNAPLVTRSTSAYSDFQTPSNITLNWIEPRTTVIGDSISDYKIHIYRDGAFLAEVDSGVLQFVDTGLTLHQLYTYSLRVVQASDSSSAVVVSAYAGGNEQSSPPTSFTFQSVAGGISMHWVNPSTQIDGTPLNDIAYIEIFRDGNLFDSLSESVADTGMQVSYFDSTSGYHNYTIRARDNEVPPHYSVFTDTLLGYAGTPLSGYFDGFESGSAGNYIVGDWDTTSAIRHDGSVCVTDSRTGTYAPNSKTYFSTPPIVIGSNYVLRFSHIALIATLDFGYVQIASYPGGAYSNLRGYNANSHSQWTDNHADSTDWFSESVSLSSFIGDTVTIRFYLLTNSSIEWDGWYIDDIYIGSATDVQNPNEMPMQFSLNQNYPNPFNPSTTISYQLQSASSVTLKVYDVLGKEVATPVNEVQEAGEHKVIFSIANSGNLAIPSGIYFYQINVRNHDGTIFSDRKKMLLLK